MDTSKKTNSQINNNFNHDEPEIQVSKRHQPIDRLSKLKIPNPLDLDIAFYREDDNYIYFGMYPQSLATQQELAGMSTYLDASGYYTSSYNNEKFVKILSSPEFSSVISNDGRTILRDLEYYFRVEEIQWRKLATDIDKLIVVSKNVLDSRRFSDPNDPNLLGNSELLNWINNDFYNTAFNSKEKKAVLKTQTGGTGPGYTFRHIGVLSYNDVITSSFGFITNPSNIDSNRLSPPTDYAKAKGVYFRTYSIPGSNIPLYSADYWLSFVIDDVMCMTVFRTGVVTINGFNMGINRIGARIRLEVKKQIVSQFL
jgi:hypothetical protein